MPIDRVVFSRQSVEWPTPTALYDQLNAEFSFTLDPCPLGGTENGLARSPPACAAHCSTCAIWDLSSLLAGGSIDAFNDASHARLIPPLTPRPHLALVQPMRDHPCGDLLAVKG